MKQDAPHLSLDVSACMLADQHRLRSRLRGIERAHEAGRPIDDALREAARDARRLHKALGNPMATWKDGQVVWVQPEDIKVDDEGTD